MSQLLLSEGELVVRIECPMTLNSAQKYMAKLKAHQGANNSNAATRRYAPLPSYVLDSRKYITAVTTAEEFSNLIEQEKLKLQEEQLQKRTVSLDIILLKDAVHKYNSENGVDKVLSMIDYVNAELAELKNIEKGSIAVNTNNELLFKKYNDEPAENRINMNITVNIYDSKQLKQQIVGLNTRINQLENERDKLNASGSITVNLSKYSLDIIGLNY
jgi:hypothetical protein